MKLPEFLEHLWKHIVDFFVKIDPKLKEIGTVAVNIVSAADAMIESPAGAAIAALIPGGVGTEVRDKLLKIIPAALETSTVVKNSADLTPDQMLEAWLDEAAKLDHDTVSGEKLTLASKIAKQLSADLEDGELSTTEATGLVFSIFNGFIKGK